MKTLIYQYWHGDLLPYSALSRDMMADYARKVGAEFRFIPNPTFFKRRKRDLYVDSMRPIFDTDFHGYDRVLYVDGDVYPTDTCSRNVFDEPIGDLAMVEEAHQPALRENSTSRINGRNDQRWARWMKRIYGIDVRRDEAGRPRVYNAGVILYSGEGMRKAFKAFPNYRRYGQIMRLIRLPRFYTFDQNYLNAATAMDGLEFTALDPVWNSQVHMIGNGAEATLRDERDAATQFAHIQLRGRSSMTRGDMQAIIDQKKA